MFDINICLNSGYLLNFGINLKKKIYQVDGKYKRHVASVLFMYCFIWDNCTTKPIFKRTGKDTNDAARVITEETKLVSIESLRSETGREALAERRYKDKILFFLNFVHRI